MLFARSEKSASACALSLSEQRFAIAVVIPCYCVASQLADVLRRIGPECTTIYCVIDGCPDASESVATKAAERDQRIKVLRHEKNGGVGCAVLSGYRQAIADGADVIVKLDGDGQMAPEDMLLLVEPILSGTADYVKGNRFFYLDNLRAMPRRRVLGNAGLSFMSKLSSGYWNIVDPTNGYTAIDARVAQMLCSEKLSPDYFFESDVLFRLNTLRAVVADVPLPARYGNEVSHLNEWKALWQFTWKHCRNCLKRIFINYFLRDFNAASLNFLVGIALLTFGIVFGLFHWIRGYELQQLASSGTVMLAALPIILGWQSLMNFILYDMSVVPKVPLLIQLSKRALARSSSETALTTSTLVSRAGDDQLPSTSLENRDA